LFTIVLAAAAVITLVVTGAAALVLPAVVGGSTHLTNLTRIMTLELAPYGIAGAATGALTAVLAVRRRYAAAVAVAGCEPLMKLVLVVLLGHAIGAQAMIAGNLIGSAIAVCSLWVILRRSGVVVTLLRRPGMEMARRMAKLSLPLIVSTSVLQINPLIDRVTASGLAHGSVTVMELGYRLFAAPMTLISTLIANPLIVTWSARRSASGWPALSASVARAAAALALVLPPVIVVGFVLRTHLVELLYSGGAYTHHDIKQTGAVMGMLLLGMPAQLLVSLLATLFLVQRNTVFPMTVAFANVCLNAILDVVLRVPLRTSGIALSTTITMTILAAVYVVGARARWGSIDFVPLRRPVILAIPSCALIAGSSLLILRLFASSSGRPADLALVGIAALVGTGIQAVVLTLGRIPIAGLLPIPNRALPVLSRLRPRQP
jgi:putative peptidoglycan lipid II flippase